MRSLLPMLLLALGAGAGCAPSAEAPGAPTIASVHHSKCGRCHTPPPRGEHSRPYLEEALAPHRRRVHLTDQEWSQLIEYLAASAHSS